MTRTWQAVRRSDDGEHVGYAAPASEDGGLVVPLRTTAPG